VIELPMPRRRALSLLFAVPLVIAGCGGTATDDATDGGDVVGTDVASKAAAAPSGDAAASDDAAWLDIPLTDAATGETFTLASLKGEVVALEPMAIWCSNCKAQQDNVKEAFADVQAAGVRYISIGVDPNEDRVSLARYADRRAYPWTFVQASTEFARALNVAFGPQILSPPSTPLIVLDPDGEVAAQTFGSHGPQQLLEILGEATAQA
jgi:cytochrome oxidase Cu insertion factor (SCO1/SenC/PrrC family)